MSKKLDELLQSLESLPPKVTDNEFQTIENFFEVSLPREFKEYYRWYDFDNLEFFGTQGIIDRTNEFSDNAREFMQRHFGEFTNAQEMLKRYCADKVEEYCPYDIGSDIIKQPSVMWPKEWIVFGEYINCDMLILDLREEMGPHKGCIISYYVECNSIDYHYLSFEAFLEDVLHQHLNNDPDDFIKLHREKS